MRIAIIGTGISGLTAAHRLHPRHDLTVYEADHRVGGHANTVPIYLDDGDWNVDTGFIVYNHRNYPTFTRLLSELRVPTQPSDMSLAIVDERHGLEWGTNVARLFSQRRRLTDLDDSKRLDDAARQRLSAAIMAVARSVVILSASPSTIDRDGLHVTNLRLLRQALAGLEPGPDVALVDGFPLGDGSPPHTAVIGGDRRSACIAAASVVAKATRDRLMAGPADERHPGYGFARHVGYATETHRHAIRTLGPSRLHRRSFASPVYEGFGPEVGS